MAGVKTFPTSLDLGYGTHGSASGQSYQVVARKTT
jgi:hypothetical protein